MINLDYRHSISYFYGFGNRFARLIHRKSGENFGIDAKEMLSLPATIM